MKVFYKKAEKIITSQVLEHIEGEDLVRRFAPKSRYWSPQRFELKLIRGQAWEHTRKLFSDANVPFGVKLAIDTALKHCRNKVCTPIIAFIPSSDVLQAKETTYKYSRILSRYATLNGLQFVDGTQAVRSLGGDAYASEGGHLSPAGYKAFAQTLAKGLGK